MPNPAAIVRIQIKRITGIPVAVLGRGDTRYARCEIKLDSGVVIRSGRSRPIPAAGGDFDLTAEAIPWSFELRLDAGMAIGVNIDITEDRGDAPPPPTPLALTFGIPDPWTSGDRTAGRGPSVAYSVTTSLITATDAAFLARAAAATGVSGTLTVPQSYVVQITGVSGLYKPRAVAVNSAGAEVVAGYISEDNLGRIYTNRLPNGNWARDTQYVDVLVRVNAIGGAAIPAGAKIRWIIEDPDDPTNDAPDFHRDWGAYIDPNDYSGATSIGAHNDDNVSAHSPRNGNPNLLFGAAASGSPTARWAAIPGGPAPAPASAAQAESPIQLSSTRLATSSVRIHCPNVLGTNLLVRAELVGGSAGIPVHNAATGVMTMWSRLDVEVARMAGAPTLAGALHLIPPFFHPVCVQLDMKLEHVVTGALDKAEMAADDSRLSTSTSAWIDNPAVFTHRGTPGWFFLGVARFPYPLPPAGPTALLYNGTTYNLSTIGNNVVLEVPVAATTAEYVEFSWPGGPTGTLEAGFMVARAAPGGLATQMVLYGNDAVPTFTGHDANGSTSHAYKSQMFFYPQHQIDAGSSSLVPGGFGVPSTGATVKVFPPGATYTSGISPPVTNPATGTVQYFAGRTVLFAHTDKFSTGTPPAPRSDFNQQVLGTVVHEFLHAFGMPHKCGQWDWRTPRQKSCCMNYWSTWLLDSSNKVLPGFDRRQGDHMCGRHLMEVRRVHLERNRGLNW